MHWKLEVVVDVVEIQESVSKLNFWQLYSDHVQKLFETEMRLEEQEWRSFVPRT